MNVHFATINNNPQKGEQLIRTCNYFSIQVTYIKPKDWQGNLQKIFEIQNFIRDKNDDDILIFADAYDCLALGGLEEAVSKFISMDCDLLCSTELNCHPFKELAKPFGGIDRDSKSRHIYPNTGLYMGRISAIKHYCHSKTREQLIQDYTFNNGSYSTDQGRFHVYYLGRHRDEELKLKLDYDCEIFQNMHKTPWKDFGFKSGRLHNNALNSKPCFLHFSGASDRIHNLEERVLTDLTDRIIFFNQNTHEKGPLTYNKAFHEQDEISQLK